MIAVDSSFRFAMNRPEVHAGRLRRVVSDSTSTYSDHRGRCSLADVSTQNFKS